MSLKCLVLVFACLFVHLQLIYSTEVTVTCKILTANYCYIENELDLKDADSLKFTVDNPDSITTLDIVQDSKLGSLPNGIFKTFPALEKIFVDGNDIDLLSADRFENGNKLKLLSMYQNKIRVIPSGVFSSLSSVEQIFLMDNRIDTIEDNAFEGVLNLRELKLDNNRIRTIGRLALTGAANIRELHLDSNLIETIEEGALSLPKLERLHLYGNKLTTLTDTLLIGAPNLVTATFSENPIESVNFAALASLEQLSMLYLDNTKLILSPEIPTYESSASKLKKISLMRIGLSNPDILKHLSVFGQLEEISAMNNNFTTINDIESVRNNFPNLKYLELGYNEPSLCDWIKDNERWLKGISVWATKKTATGETLCRSADFVFKEPQPGN